MLSWEPGERYSNMQGRPQCACTHMSVKSRARERPVLRMIGNLFIGGAGAGAVLCEGNRKSEHVIAGVGLWGG